MPVIIATDDLPTILSKYGLAKYTDLFLRHEVDLQTFATLTEQDLREIGVQTFGARKKLLLLANSKFTICHFVSCNTVLDFALSVKLDNLRIEKCHMFSIDQNL